MGINTYPAPSSGGIKSVQRGLASASGNVTITSVDINKSFVTVFGTTSSGTIAATGSVGGFTGTLVSNGGSNPYNFYAGAGGGTNMGNVNLNASNITGGTNNLVSAVVQGYLSNSTTLVVSGACRWEVVEFN